MTTDKLQTVVLAYASSWMLGVYLSSRLQSRAKQKTGSWKDVQINPHVKSLLVQIFLQFFFSREIGIVAKSVKVCSVRKFPAIQYYIMYMQLALTPYQFPTQGNSLGLLLNQEGTSKSF